MAQIPVTGRAVKPSDRLVGADSLGRPLPAAGSARLSYRLGTSVIVFRFWLEEIEQQHSLAGSTSQSQFFKHFYAKGYAPAPLMVTGRVRDQQMYDQLAEYIRNHQILLVSTRGSNNPSGSAQKYQLPLMTLTIPSEGLVYAGWIETFNAGAKRFNPAPQFTFAFSTIDDRHSTNDKLVPSHALKSVFSGAFLEGPIEQQQQTAAVEQQQQNSASAVQQQIQSANIIKTTVTEPDQ